MRLGSLMGVVIALTIAAFCSAATRSAPAGELDEIALTLHEAWSEARLSMDDEHLNREWAVLVQALQKSLQGRARVVVSGGSLDWRVRLHPVGGHVGVEATPSGVRLVNDFSKEPERYRFASEIIKWQVNAGRRRELYFFRDEQGLEVDFLVPKGAGTLLLLEAKASRTLTPSMANPIVRLRRAMTRRKTEAALVGQLNSVPSRALLPGVSAYQVDELHKLLSR